MFENERAVNLSDKIDQLLNGTQNTKAEDLPDDEQLLSLAGQLLSDPPFQPNPSLDQQIHHRLEMVAARANPHQAKTLHRHHQITLVLRTIVVFIFFVIFTFGLFKLYGAFLSTNNKITPQPAIALSATELALQVTVTQALPQMTATPIIPQALAVIREACNLNAADTFIGDHNNYPDLPKAFIGGGHVESGEFKFDLWLSCDDQYNNHQPSGADTFSEINGLGMVASWTYTGKAQDGTITDYTGFEPFIRQTSSSSPIGNTLQSILNNGIQFDNTIIPDFSQQDTHLRYVFFTELPDGARYGATMSFTLQREVEGYRPVDIQVNGLSTEELVNIENQDKNDLPFATRNPIENFPILNNIKTKLESWQNSLTNPPGWLYMKTTIEDYSGNTLYGGINNYINESWYDLDENGRSLRTITQISTIDGRVLQQSVYANGLGRNLTFNTSYNNSPTKLNLIQDLIETLTNQARSSEDLEPPILDWQGRAAWMFVSSDTFDEPVNMGNNRSVNAVEGREYVDMQTGERLGEETFIYTAEGGEELQWRSINTIYERIDSPPQQVLALLDQENGTYSPPVAQGIQPPEGFDPSSQPLKLLSYPGDDFELPSFWVGDIYAGEYLLGRVNFGGVPGGRCQRSQDGSLIAYINETQSNDEPYSSRVAWINLMDMTTIYQPSEDLSVRSMSASWAPIKPEFVLTACLQNNTQCGIYLVDTVTNTTRLLSTTAVSIWPIIWKPDGNQIAMIDTSDDQHRLFIIDVANGTTIYQGYFDAENWQVPINSPMADWGVTFPRNSDEETGCFK
jgi:hypothetical protein